MIKFAWFLYRTLVLALVFGLVITAVFCLWWVVGTVLLYAVDHLQIDHEVAGLLLLLLIIAGGVSYHMEYGDD